MKDPLTYFFKDLNFKEQSALFKKLLYIFLIIKSAYWLFSYDLLFGPHSVITVNESQIEPFKAAAFFLYAPANHHLCLWALIAVIVLSIFGLFFKKLYFINDLVLWFLILNLHNRVYSTLSGGDYLLNQLLFFNCFISNGFDAKKTWPSQLRICLHNFGVLAVLIQVCLAYFISGITKAQDATWLSGEAVACTSEVDHFNLYRGIVFSRDSFLAHLLNYTVILYQLLFPVLIWLGKLKKPLILMGICIHLYIAFVIGLIGFGIIMIIPYVFFWPRRQRLMAD
ncbi:MAG: hypothetical protein H0W61_06395 [Bacteroidetes bacterium]|nr:hypothetical protein [Bacteroidota bacterium]